jgi:hypothetical protein
MHQESVESLKNPVLGGLEQYGEAEQLLRGAIRRYESLKIPRSFRILGLLLERQGYYKESEIYRRVADSHERILRPEHLFTLS